MEFVRKIVDASLPLHNEALLIAEQIGAGSASLIIMNLFFNINPHKHHYQLNILESFFSQIQKYMLP